VHVYQAAGLPSRDAGAVVVETVNRAPRRTISGRQDRPGATRLTGFGPTIVNQHALNSPSDSRSSESPQKPAVRFLVLLGDCGQ
jgi:hypothetical protein